MKKAGSASMKKAAVDSTAKIHPSRRLVSTKGITQGQPLKNLLRPFTVDLIDKALSDEVHSELAPSIHCGPHR